MVSDCCSDPRPIIHLKEVNKISLFDLFSKIFITDYILDELKIHNIQKLPKKFEIKKFNKDAVFILSKKYELEIGESSVIVLCKSLQAKLILTDDLRARDISKMMGIKPVGTIGIILRSFREGFLTEKDAIILLKKIYNESSLFITKDLIDSAIQGIRDYNK